MKISNGMKNFFKWALVIAFMVFLLFSLQHNRQSVRNLDTNNIQYVKIAGQMLKVELALTNEEQEQGLSWRKDLEENQGMLFVFDHSSKYSFWMKNMNFPIDIIWLAPPEAGLGEDLHVVYIKKDAKPESFPEIFEPNENSKYVLEVISGFSEKNNLKEGDNAKFLP